jgi:hypothetical protein
MDGTYRFTDVVPGIYTLAITVPDGYVAVGQTRRTVSVPSGGSVRSNFILQARGVIQGVVFDDFNGNGVQDSDEAGVGGVVVSQSSGVTTTTSLDGGYRFSNVAPGSYTLGIAVPAGYVPAGPSTSTVNVAIGGSVQANFAVQVQGVLGVVFDDLNGNNRQDGGEPGLGGVSIALEGGATVITSLDGKYRFSNVAPGSYILYLDVPAGYVSVGRTSRTVTVAAGGSARANFALQAESVLQGVVFDDLNGNGAQDVGEAGRRRRDHHARRRAGYDDERRRQLQLHERRAGRLHALPRRAGRLYLRRADQPRCERGERRLRTGELCRAGAGRDPGRGLRRPQRQQ